MMEQNNGELSFATKVKIVGTMALVVGVLLASAVGYTSYQRNAKIEAAALLQKQIAAAMAHKAILPLFRDTAFGKNYLVEQGEKNMVKVNQSALPATITSSELSTTVAPNPGCLGYPAAVGNWSVFDSSGTAIASDSVPNGWDVVNPTTVSIPAGVEYGKYSFGIITNETCDPGGSPGSGHVITYYTFKITPPCPTVTLTATGTRVTE